MRLEMTAMDVLRKRLGFAKPFLEALFSLEARVSEWWVAGAHHRLFLAQWGILPVPEFFDHKIGLYWMWKAKRAPHWVERGVFSLLAIEPGSRALAVMVSTLTSFTASGLVQFLQSILTRKPLLMLESTFARRTLPTRLPT